jgi:hypothetical protein
MDDPAQKTIPAEHFNAFFLRHEKQGRFGRAEHSPGMRRKCDDCRSGSGFFRHITHGTQNRLMPQMHTVKNTDTRNDPGGNGSWFFDIIQLSFILPVKILKIRFDLP